jgi:hypothetical protein
MHTVPAFFGGHKFAFTSTVVAMDYIIWNSIRLKVEVLKVLSRSRTFHKALSKRQLAIIYARETAADI